MSKSSIFTLIWPLFSLVCGGVMIAATVLLLREQSAATWMMLAGSLITLLGRLASSFMPLFLNGKITSDVMLIVQACSALSGLGGLIFSIGLLLHALNRRNQATRIAELESILADRSNR